MIIGFLVAGIIALGSLVSGVLSKVIAEEFKEWLPWLQEYFLKIGLAAFPPETRREKEEEWRSQIESVPGLGTRAIVMARLAVWPILRNRCLRFFIAVCKSVIKTFASIVKTGLELFDRLPTLPDQVKVGVVCIVALLLLPSRLQRQPDEPMVYSKASHANYDDGRRIYFAACAGCHLMRGVDADYLKQGRFRDGTLVTTDSLHSRVRESVFVKKALSDTEIDEVAHYLLAGNRYSEKAP